MRGRTQTEQNNGDLLTHSFWCAVRLGCTVRGGTKLCGCFPWCPLVYLRGGPPVLVSPIWAVLPAFCVIPCCHWYHNLQHWSLCL